MKLRAIVISFALIIGIAVVFMETPALAQTIVDGGVPAGADSARGNSQPTDLFGQSGMFEKITNVLLYLIGAISVIMIIVGGLRYVLSGGNSANITAAKNTILYAIVGVIVAILAYAAIAFVIGSFANNSSVGVGGGSGSGSATSF
jgi:hypothetical protein